MLATALACGLTACMSPEAQVDVEARSVRLVLVGGLQFRDMDRNLALTPYEDWRLSSAERAADLLSHMTLEEKLGTLMHATLPSEAVPDGQEASAYDIASLEPLVAERGITSFITRLAAPPAEMARANNRVQLMAEATRLAIPITISTDPRNHFQYVPGATSSPSGNSQWPEALGFAALGDTQLMREFADIARKEYRAVGIHMALSPQLDVVSEPRWSRATGTFGSDPELISRMGAAYVAGFQGGDEGVQNHGVMTVAKHWAGYGAQPEGFDGHNYYGRFARPGENFAAHIAAFDGALQAGTAGIMPAYPILQDTQLDGEALEQVSPGFSGQLLDGLLRDEKAYAGFVLSDWAITRDCNARCLNPSEDEPQGWPDVATPWGVEGLSVGQRYVKGLLAGIDQFGGTDDIAPLIAAVEAGDISLARIDQSVLRILQPKFALGLFDNPYVDEQNAADIIGNLDDLTLAATTQARAQVMLQGCAALPLAEGSKLWVHGVDPAAVEDAGFLLVDKPEEADFAIIRASTPFERLHPFHRFGSFQNEGRLDFRPDDPAYGALMQAHEYVPTVFAIFLDRPAILSNIVDKADVIIGNFGADDAALFAVLKGREKAQGHLPFALPRTMEQVAGQDPGAADDIDDPLFPRGFAEQANACR